MGQLLATARGEGLAGRHRRRASSSSSSSALSSCARGGLAVRRRRRRLPSGRARGRRWRAPPSAFRRPFGSGRSPPSPSPVRVPAVPAAAAGARPVLACSSLRAAAAAAAAALPPEPARKALTASHRQQLPHRAALRPADGAPTPRADTAMRSARPASRHGHATADTATAHACRRAHAPSRHRHAQRTARLRTRPRHSQRHSQRHG